VIFPRQDPGGYQETGARLDIDIAVETLGM
jgi:hypothetical protein